MTYWGTRILNLKGMKLKGQYWKSGLECSVASVLFEKIKGCPSTGSWNQRVILGLYLQFGFFEFYLQNSIYKKEIWFKLVLNKKGIN